MGFGSTGQGTDAAWSARGSGVGRELASAPPHDDPAPGPPQCVWWWRRPRGALPLCPVRSRGLQTRSSPLPPGPRFIQLRVRCNDHVAPCRMIRVRPPCTANRAGTLSARGDAVCRSHRGCALASMPGFPVALTGDALSTPATVLPARGVTLPKAVRTYTSCLSPPLSVPLVHCGAPTLPPDNLPPTVPPWFLPGRTDAGGTKAQPAAPGSLAVLDLYQLNNRPPPSPPAHSLLALPPRL